MGYFERHTMRILQILILVGFWIAMIIGFDVLYPATCIYA